MDEDMGVSPACESPSPRQTNGQRAAERIELEAAWTKRNVVENVRKAFDINDVPTEVVDRLGVVINDIANLEHTLELLGTAVCDAINAREATKT